MDERVIELVGLDVETTGLDPQKHIIVQIGLSLYTGDNGFSGFVSDVGWDYLDIEIDEEALAVNGFTLDRIENALYREQVEQNIRLWLKEYYSIYNESVFIPVGWNVGSFDMLFFQKAFPALFKDFFSHRSLDLNSLCFAMMGNFSGSTKKDYKYYKDGAKAYAAELANIRGRPINWHDAGFNAWASIQSFRWLRNEMSILL